MELLVSIAKHNSMLEQLNKKWGFLYATERFEDNEIINVLKCQNCDSEFCCTCGIDQEKHGLTLSDNPVQYTAYKNALRKLKYIRDGN